MLPDDFTVSAIEKEQAHGKAAVLTLDTGWDHLSLRVGMGADREVTGQWV